MSEKRLILTFECVDTSCRSCQSSVNLYLNDERGMSRLLVLPVSEDRRICDTKVLPSVDMASQRRVKVGRLPRAIEVQSKLVIAFIRQKVSANPGSIGVIPAI